MCRWLGYLGSPIEPRELLYDPERSLIEQSRRHAPDMAVPNGDGFGLGWYGRREVPAVFHSATPAWGDRNLHTLASEISSPLFLAHVRAATGTPVQETNCHPFARGRWLFVHNGYVDGYETLRRDLLLAVRPDLFPNIKGTTDSELLFHLALTFGLEDDPIGGLERMAGFVESLGAAAGIAEPLQMTVGVTDGERLWAARYASGPVANTLLPQRGRRVAARALPGERAVRPLRRRLPGRRLRAARPAARALARDPRGHGARGGQGHWTSRSRSVPADRSAGMITTRWSER